MLLWRICLGIFLLGFDSLYLSSEAWSKSPSTSATNPLFGLTHIQPSPLTLPAGIFVYGTDLAYGLTPSIQISTGLLRDLFQIYNAEAKVKLFANQSSALALTFGVDRFNPSRWSVDFPRVTVTTYQPGGIVAIALHPRLAWFLGGNYQFTQTQVPQVQSGYVRGARAGSDLTWMYGGGGRTHRTGNAVSVGYSRDFTYGIYGIGMSHHWSGFQLGLHYYPNARNSQYLPIIAGGGSFAM